MFKFLKDKLKSTISKFSEKIKKEGTVVEEKEEVQEPAEEKKPPEEVSHVVPEKKEALSEAIPLAISEKKEASPKEPEKPIAEKPAEEIAETFSEEKEKIAPPDEEILEEKPAERIEETLPEEKEEHFLAREEVTEKKSVVAVEPPLEIATPKPLPSEEKKEVEEKPVEKKGFFSRFKEKVSSTKINEVQFENFFGDLELALLENNVAVEVIDKIKHDLKEDLVDVPIKRRKVDETIRQTLRASIGDLFAAPIDVMAHAQKKKPFVICFFGINGAGKTTTIAKVTRLLQDKKMSVILAAADTFRAASIEQLQLHADALNVPLIKHDYGSDPAAVAFDAIKHAESKKVDVVLIDTAGRQHSNKNLIAEMEKIIRVAKPDLKIFVGESITGNDCVEQATQFNNAVGIDAIILTKADVDEKGGAAVSVSYVTGKPILYLGVGQEYSDLMEFNAEKIMSSLGF